MSASNLMANPHLPDYGQCKNVSLETLLADVSRRAKLSGWQPIETAPKGDGRENGPEIIVAAFYEGGATSGIATWWWHPNPSDAEDGGRWEIGSHGAERFVPTHWMPLPTPPA
jgi:hypothetical protein